MKALINFLPADNLRRNRLMLLAAIVFLFLTLAYCHSQKPVTESDTATDAVVSDTSAESDLDSDGDGAPDNLDACPQKAGAAIDNGCPIDSDGDGVSDQDDLCPAKAGALDGCPADRDKDGITDAEDACPDNAGTATNQGCPIDSDGDGVGDAIDQCPQTSGLAEHSGCAAALELDADSANPDSTNDAGPEVSATHDTNTAVGEQAMVAGASDEASTDGVVKPDELKPDTDGDGLTDDTDQCPQQYGDEANAGCPPDTDGDGIPDIDDNCPKVAGLTEAAGCLTSESDGQKQKLDTQDQQVLDEAVAKVAFDSNSATLTTESRELLKAVATLMQKYPEAILEIRGHTDASGVADDNMQLSMARARSAAAYIVSVGIDVNRIRAFGYGESQPIANNNSAEGRRINRRVEFELLFVE